jgi:ABC-type multidrug transport system ATPase subunit
VRLAGSSREQVDHLLPDPKLQQEATDLIRVLSYGIRRRLKTA